MLLSSGDPVFTTYSGVAMIAFWPLIFITFNSNPPSHRSHDYYGTARAFRVAIGPIARLVWDVVVIADGRDEFGARGHYRHTVPTGTCCAIQPLTGYYYRCKVTQIERRNSATL